MLDPLRELDDLLLDVVMALLDRRLHLPSHLLVLLLEGLVDALLKPLLCFLVSIRRALVHLLGNLR